MDGRQSDATVWTALAPESHCVRVQSADKSTNGSVDATPKPNVRMQLVWNSQHFNRVNSVEWTARIFSANTKLCKPGHPVIEPDKRNDDRQPNFDHSFHNLNGKKKRVIVVLVFANKILLHQTHRIIVCCIKQSHWHIIWTIQFWNQRTNERSIDRKLLRQTGNFHFCKWLVYNWM